MTDKLVRAYEKALEAHWADRDDEGKHRAAVEAGEALARSRRSQREADIEAGVRSAGLGVVTEKDGV